MRTITPELEALLRSRFQAAGDGFAARFEVDTPVPAGGAPTLIQDNWTTPNDTTVLAVTLPSNVTLGNRLVLIVALAVAPPGAGMDTPPGWSLETTESIAAWKFADRTMYIFTKVADNLDTDSWSVTQSGTPGVGRADYYLAEYSPADVDATFSVAAPNDSYDDNTLVLTPTAAGSPVAVVVGGVSVSGNTPATTGITVTGDLPEILEVGYGAEGRFAIASLEDASAAASYSSTFTGTGQFAPATYDRTFMVGIILVGAVAAPVTTTYRPKRINLNKNLRMGPDQAEVELANEDLELGYGPTSIFRTNSRCRVYQWFGDPANEVLTFTGIIDKVADDRDPLTTRLTCRSLAGAILVDQTFSTTAPQGADESGAVRTEDNGVYLAREVDYVVADILDRLGWPADSIDIADTSFVLDEYIREDGASGWDDLERLAAFVGYAVWDDEDAVLHFRTRANPAGVDDPLTADYEYEIGVGL